MSISKGQLRLSSLVSETSLAYLGMCAGGTVDVLDKGCGIWSCQAGAKERPQRSFVHVVKELM